jgi:ribonuclease VapC
VSSEPPRTCVLDASALLAFLHGEPGSEAVRPMISGALISSVNWAEVVQKSLDWGVAVTGLREDLAALGLRILPFTWAQAEQAAELWLTTKSLGLSLADRACLALGLEVDLPVLTADRTWQGVGARIAVQLIR